MTHPKNQNPPPSEGGGRNGGENMEIKITGGAKEIAALVLELQERQGRKVVIDPKAVSKAIRGTDSASR